MLTTCGIYLYSTRKRKFLVCHPTRASWSQWSIPKGLREGNEEFLDVAKRELLEETGVDLARINVLGIFPLRSIRYLKKPKVLESFLVITDTDLGEHKFITHSMTALNYPEIDSWKWIRKSKMKLWLHESQRQNLPMIEELIEGIVGIPA